MKKQVSIFPINFKDSPHFSHSVREGLYLSFTQNERDKDQDWYKTIEEAIKKGNHHIEDVLMEFLQEELYLDLTFARNLNMYDIIDLDCFEFKGSLGEAIYKFLSCSDTVFIVYQKKYLTKDRISLDCVMTPYDNELECHTDLIKGKYELRY